MVGALARRFGREIGAVGIRLMAYLGALALLAMPALQLLPAVQAMTHGAAPSVRPQWVAVERPHTAFAVSFLDLANAGYRAERDTAGEGRKDILTFEGNGRSASIEILRLDHAPPLFPSPGEEVAARIDGVIEDIEHAPQLETRFGPVWLADFTLVDGDHRRGCLAFVRTLQDPRLQISGWLCNAGPGMVGRAAVACAFDKLTLLSAGSDPKLARAFAQAELKGPYCVHKRVRPSAARPADWVEGRQAVKLRSSAM
jgi:hypothetical protein